MPKRRRVLAAVKLGVEEPLPRRALPGALPGPRCRFARRRSTGTQEKRSVVEVPFVRLLPKNRVAHSVFLLR